MLKNTRFIIMLLFILFFCVLLRSIPVFALENSATERLSGSDRYGTSIAISKSGWEQSTTVIIASGLGYADALSASALSKSKDAPILLTKKDVLDQITIDELKRLKSTQAFLIGGTGVIGTGIEKQLTDLGIVITRIAGMDRYDTSEKVAEIVGATNGIIISSGLNFPDALSIAPIASIKSIPILLSPKNSLSPNMLSFIKGKSIPASYIVGGLGALATSIDPTLPNSTRLSGVDRYATNLSINAQFSDDLNFNTIYLASGNDFPDALGGAALAAKNNAPIFLTDKNSISKATVDFIKSKNVQHIVILGAAGAVSQTVETTVNATLNSMIVHPTSVSLNKTTAALLVGGTDTLTAAVTPDNALNKAISWTSSANTVVSVDSTGYITALSEGSATITATSVDGGITATCTVTTTNPVVPVTSVSLKATDALTVSGTNIITMAGTDTLTAIFAPYNATNKTLSWTSSNPSIVLVDDTGKITSIAPGTSTITVTTADGNKTAACIVTVTVAPVAEVTSITLNKSSAALVVGKTDTLTATINPNTANKVAYWSSSDDSIVKVDYTGTITGVSEGSATITATSADWKKTETCIVTVAKKPSMKIMIDPGHGGYDTGAIGPNGVLEKNVNLAIALKVGDILKQNGVDVVYTRTSDDVSWPAVEAEDLQVRCDLANAANINYFVCIHANSFTNPSTNGVETYYESGNSAGQALAQSIQQELVTSNGLLDRGIKTANYYVLKNIDAPAILTEVAFISNPTEESLLNSTDFQNKSAQGIANGILKILN